MKTKNNTKQNIKVVTNYKNSSKEMISLNVNRIISNIINRTINL